MEAGVDGKARIARLGKGTPNLEGYELRGKGYFGPGELPSFKGKEFEIPHGTKEEWLFKEFKRKVEENGGTPDAEAVQFANELSRLVKEGVSRTDE